MPNRLRYHERRLIARGLAKESDFKKSTQPETAPAPKVEANSEEQKEGILDKLKISKQED